MEEMTTMSAIINRFYIIYQELFTENDALKLINENNRREPEKKIQFVASKMERITPEARALLNANEIPVRFY